MVLDSWGKGELRSFSNDIFNFKILWVYIFSLFLQCFSSISGSYYLSSFLYKFILFDFFIYTAVLQRCFLFRASLLVYCFIFTYNPSIYNSRLLLGFTFHYLPKAVQFLLQVCYGTVKRSSFTVYFYTVRLSALMESIPYSSKQTGCSSLFCWVGKAPLC